MAAAKMLTSDVARGGQVPVLAGLRTPTTVAATLVDGKKQCIYRIEGLHGGSFEQVVKRFFSSRRPASGVRCRIWIGRLPTNESTWEPVEGWFTSIKRPNRGSKYFHLGGIVYCIDPRTDTRALVRFTGTYPNRGEVKIGIIRPQKEKVI